jgi:K+-transporting ATPase KdpF subunit
MKIRFISIILPILIVPFTAMADDKGKLGYPVGAVIAIIILGYLVYSLIKPEKF